LLCKDHFCVSNSAAKHAFKLQGKRDAYHTRNSNLIWRTAFSNNTFRSVSYLKKFAETYVFNYLLCTYAVVVHINCLKSGSNYEVWSKTTVNAAAECDPTERQGFSIREAARRTLVTVCDKFQLVRRSQSVVSYGW